MFPFFDYIIEIFLTFFNRKNARIQAVSLKKFKDKAIVNKFVINITKTMLLY